MKAMPRDQYDSLNDDLCCVRDLMKTLELASGMISGLEISALSRVAGIAIERLDRALDRLEAFEPVPNVVRKEMA
ncbi:hypothetical protein FJU08_11595 [Martelella alba]|uniref:Uncharacterized protein n=1 Tax=Martelella alba TaxID=2590451 RepID=A0A506UAD6_9HYPH|nr:hypothetical protein [Martelella alba]TPW30316.1 hypothetical protein FJU08_11595 [Martelella alba]